LKAFYAERKQRAMRFRLIVRIRNAERAAKGESVLLHAVPCRTIRILRAVFARHAPILARESKTERTDEIVNGTRLRNRRAISGEEKDVTRRFLSPDILRAKLSSAVPGTPLD